MLIFRSSEHTWHHPNLNNSLIKLIPKKWALCLNHIHHSISLVKWSELLIHQHQLRNLHLSKRSIRKVTQHMVQMQNWNYRDLTWSRAIVWSVRHKDLTCLKIHPLSINTQLMVEFSIRMKAWHSKTQAKLLLGHLRVVISYITLKVLVSEIKRMQVAQIMGKIVHRVQK